MQDAPQFLCRAVARTAALALVLASFAPAHSQQGAGAFNGVMQAANPVPQACYTVNWSRAEHDIAQLQQLETSLQSDISFLDGINDELSENQTGLVGAQLINGSIGFADVYYNILREIAVDLDKTGSAEWLMLTADVTVGFTTAVISGVSIPDAKARDQQVTQDVLGTFYKVGSAAVGAAKDQFTKGKQLLGANVSIALKLKNRADAINGLVDKGLEYGKRAQQMGEIHSELSAHKRSVRADIQRLFDIAQLTRLKLRSLQREAQAVALHCPEGQAQSVASTQCAQLVADAGQAADGRTFGPMYARLKQECPAGDSEKARVAYMVNASKMAQTATAQRVGDSTQQAIAGIGNAQASVSASYSNNSSVQSSIQSLREAQAYDARIVQMRAASAANQSGRNWHAPKSWEEISGGGGPICGLGNDAPSCANRQSTQRASPAPPASTTDTCVKATDSRGITYCANAVKTDCTRTAEGGCTGAR